MRYCGQRAARAVEKQALSVIREGPCLVKMPRALQTFRGIWLRLPRLGEMAFLCVEYIWSSRNMPFPGISKDSLHRGALRRPA